MTSLPAQSHKSLSRYSSSSAESRTAFQRGYLLHAFLCPSQLCRKKTLPQGHYLSATLQAIITKQAHFFQQILNAHSSKTFVHQAAETASFDLNQTV